MATKKIKKEEEKVTQDEAQAPKKLFMLTDETIALVRELLQLTLYTGTNIIDHLRNVRLEESAPGHLIPNAEYVEAYNKMVEDFARRANEMAEEARLAEAAAKAAASNNTTKH